MNPLDQGTGPQSGSRRLRKEWTRLGAKWLSKGGSLLYRGGHFWEYSSMPSRRIFDSSVWRGVPSFARCSGRSGNPDVGLGESSLVEVAKRSVLAHIASKRRAHFALMPHLWGNW